MMGNDSINCWILSRHCSFHDVFNCIMMPSLMPCLLPSHIYFVFSPPALKKSRLKNTQNTDNFRIHVITLIFLNNKHNSNDDNNNNTMALMSHIHYHNGKHEVDLPDTKATTGLHMVIEHISKKIVRASCILSVYITKRTDL